MSPNESNSLKDLRTVVTIVEVGVILFCVYVTVGTIAATVNPGLLNCMIAGSPWSPGIALALPRESLTSSQWRAFCLSIGVWTIPIMGLGIVIVEQIRRILGDAAAGSPFTVTNASRVRNIGMTFFGVAICSAMRDFTFGDFVRANVKIPGVQVLYGSDAGLTVAFIGLMILAIGEVIRYGVRLQQEHDLTI